MSELGDKTKKKELDSEEEGSIKVGLSYKL